MGFLLSLKESHQVARTKGFPTSFLSSPDGPSMVPQIAIWCSSPNDPKPKYRIPKDPKPKDPKPKDPNPRDPKPKDPKTKDPKAEDPKPKDPKPKDPKHRDPISKDPESKDAEAFLELQLVQLAV